MNIILKHIWRNIKSNSLRSVLIVISLALSSAVFYLCLNINNDVKKSTLTLLSGIYGDYDVVVTGDTDNSNISFDNCDSVLSLKTSYIDSDTNPSVIYQGDISRLIDEGLIKVYEYMDGFSNWKTSYAAMTRTRALHYNVALGERFTITSDEGDKEFVLACYLDSVGMFTPKNSQIAGIFVFGSEKDSNLFFLTLSDESKIDEEISNIKKSYPDLNVSRLYDASSAKDEAEKVSNLMTMILFFVMAITIYVISSTQSLIINYRMPVLGTFRSIGASKKYTDLILVAENALYGLISSIPGILFGEIFRIVFNVKYLEVEKGGMVFAYVLLVPLFTIALNVFVSLFAIIRVGNTPIKELIFKKQSSISIPNKKQTIFGLVFLVLSFLLALGNDEYDFFVLILELVFAIVGAGLLMGPLCVLFSNLFQRIAKKIFNGGTWLGIKNLGTNRINRSNAILVSVVISLVLVVYIGVNSISSFFTSYEKNYPYDILVKSASGAESDFDYFYQIPGVTRVDFEYWDYRYEVINGENVKVCMVANDGFSNGIEAENGILKHLKNGQAVLDRMFANKHGFKLGDTLTISRDGKTIRFKIVGLCDSGVFNSSRTTIVITRDDFFKYVEVDPAIIGVYTSRDVYMTIDRINYATSVASGELYDVTAKEDYVNDDIYEAMSAIQAVSIVPVLTIILAVFGLVNNQLISFNQKKTEYAVLYSIAMSKKQLKKMIFSELCSSFVIGCLFGSVLSIWITKIVRDIVFVNLSYIPLTIDWNQIILYLLFLFILLCSTCIFPQKLLDKMEITTEIKYE